MTRPEALPMVNVPKASKEDADDGGKFQPEKKGKGYRIFLLLTQPNSSRGAKIFSWYFDLLVILSMLTFCCESLPAWSSTIAQRAAWFALESFISLNFALDLTLKLATQPAWRTFLQSWDFPIDALSIVPWGFDLYWLASLLVDGAARNYTSLRLLRLLRFGRFFRVVLGTFPRMNLFVKALRRSGLALLFLIIYIFGAGLFFSGCLFFAETSVCTLDRVKGVWLKNDDLAQPCPIQNMFEAIWLCVATMTTVGYGDLVPQTAPGKTIAGLVMLTSMIFLPLPASIFGANLTELYLETRLAKRLDKRRATKGNNSNNQSPHPNDSEAESIHNEEEERGGLLSWPTALYHQPEQVLTMRDTANLFSMMEALEANTDQVSRQLAQTNNRLAHIRAQQRNFESIIIQQYAAASGRIPCPPPPPAATTLFHPPPSPTKD